MKPVTVREWGTLKVGKDPSLTPEQADRVVKLAKRVQNKLNTPVLDWHDRETLKAQQVVGVLATPDRSIEILPKINGEDDAVRKSLIRMLAVSEPDINITEDELSGIDFQNYDLLEILIRLFANRLIFAVRHGLPRRYVSYEDDLPLLRGKLVVPRQVRSFAFRPEIFACRYDELSQNTPLNKVLKATVHRLLNAARSYNNIRLLTELRILFDTVEDSRDPLSEKVILDRTNTTYHELYRFALLFLRMEYQSTTHGSKQGFTLLFPMNELFEKFIGAALKRRLGTDRVKLQRCDRSALADRETNASLFYLKPDIVVKSAGSRVILDTKWKELKSSKNHFGVKESDVYQMLAYLRAYGANRVILLYPWSKGNGVDKGLVARWSVAEGTNEAHRKFDIATIDIGKLSEGEAIGEIQENLISILQENECAKQAA